MRYLPYAVLALAAYTLVAPLTKLAMQELPYDAVAFVTNAMLAVVALGVIIATDTDLSATLSHPSARYMYAAGALLAVGILAYYRALSLGPVSIVVPVFGLFLVTSSAAGVLLLDEAVTARKVLAVGLAITAVFLVATE